ncbi:MAG: DUF7218 family protein [Nocardioidaceae bacterium]
MPGGKKPGPSVKDDKMYEELREKGESKTKAARIANASSNTSRKNVAKKGGQSPSYDDWSKSDLYDRAKDVGVEGRSSMNKQQLIKALRNS